MVLIIFFSLTTRTSSATCHSDIIENNMDDVETALPMLVEAFVGELGFAEVNYRAFKSGAVSK